MYGLYPIVDLDTLGPLGLSPLAFAERVLAAGPRLLQLRAKHSSARETLALLRALRVLCQRTGTLLFANDRPDLAVLAGADGVHVGQHDLPVAAVRTLAPALRVGISSHSLKELEAALSCHPDYVAFGPVFETASKQNPEPLVGLDALSLAARACQSRGVPLVAIGGIDLSRAPAIAERGALGAVIGALVQGSLEKIEQSARQLHLALGGR